MRGSGLGGSPTDRGYASDHGCRGDRGHSHGRGRDDRPSEASSRGDEGWATDDGEKSGAGHAPAPRCGQSAKKQRGEYEPTRTVSVISCLVSLCLRNPPRSSERRRDRYACCAYHGRRHRHRGGPRTRRTQSCKSRLDSAALIGELGGKLTVCCWRTWGPGYHSGPGGHS